MNWVSVTWTLVVLVVAVFAWYHQRKWEDDHPGKRGSFFADSFEEMVDPDCSCGRRHR